MAYITDAAREYAKKQRRIRRAKDEFGYSGKLLTKEAEKFISEMNQKYGFTADRPEGITILINKQTDINKLKADLDARNLKYSFAKSKYDDEDDDFHKYYIVVKHDQFEKDDQQDDQKVLFDLLRKFSYTFREHDYIKKHFVKPLSFDELMSVDGIANSFGSGFGLGDSPISAIIEIGMGTLTPSADELDTLYYKLKSEPDYKNALFEEIDDLSTRPFGENGAPFITKECAKKLKELVLKGLSKINR